MSEGKSEVNRRSFLGLGAGALAVAALANVGAEAQSKETMQKGQQDHSASNPGPVNKPVAGECWEFRGAADYG